MTKRVALADIRLDGDTQPRVAINEDTVIYYAERMREGDAFPAVAVYFDGAEYWLADGFHRYHATKANGGTATNVMVYDGTRRDAVLYSVAANVASLLPRTNADKRKAVMTLLNDEEWATWSNREVARCCRVNPSLVDNMRNEHVTAVKRQLEVSGHASAPRTHTTKHGTEATMQTENIGKARRRVIEPENESQTRAEVKAAMAMEGASRGAMIQLPKRDATLLVANAVTNLQAIATVLDQVDPAALVSHVDAAQWANAIKAATSTIRGFARQLTQEVA